VRQNLDKAAAEQRRDGRGPITAHLLELEEHQQARFGNVNGMRRPQYALRALRAGDPVEFPVSLIPRSLWLPGWTYGQRVIVYPDM
jgi:hypothetical protein